MTDTDHFADAGAGPIEPVTAFAPGRVNLIGDHTDYTGGLAMPMALDLGTEVVFFPDPTSESIELSSSVEAEAARVPISVAVDSWDLGMLLPEWARFVGAVAGVVRPQHGGKGSITTTLPVGAGLSSSASLTIALALSLGFSGNSWELAVACQRAEHAASGVSGGLLDQLAITASIPGHALLLDFASLRSTHVPIPEECCILIAHCGVTRSLVTSAYMTRRKQCESAEEIIGPLRVASPFEVDRLADPVLRRRARHVVSENRRVRQFAGALEVGDLRAAGRLMSDSHASLSLDFEVSVPELDALVSRLQAVPGIYGARMTGAGFGGCAVALAARDVVSLPIRGVDAWFAPAGGAACRRG